MSLSTKFFRYSGAAIALIGVAISAAFIGRRTAEPMATMFWNPLPIWIKIGGIIGGLAVMVAGLAVFGRLGSTETTGGETAGET